jgi:RND family efflux transporter MFP subunit
MMALERAPATVTFLSPVTGHVMEKPVVAGAAVKAGDRVLRLSDRSTMWLNVRIYEQDFPFVYEGQTVTATVAAVPGRRFEGTISFVHPHVDPATRTALVRVTLPNRDGVLRQGMYASTDLHAELTPRALLVPRQAVIDTGTRQIAFIALDRGRFEPRNVTVGSAADDGMVQIVEGLAPGERVVTSGQFLLDAESRLREAIQKNLEAQRLSAETVNHGQHAH